MSPTLSLVMLAPSLASTFMSVYPPHHGYFFTGWPSDYYSLNTYEGCGTQTYRTPTWKVTSDSYSLQTRLPDMEPASLLASLSADQASVKVIGKRSIEGCSCEPTKAVDIPLPYRPRPEDVSITFQYSVLTLNLARHAKAVESVPLAITFTSTTKGDSMQEADLQRQPDKDGSTSNVERSVEVQEKKLVDKFRAAGLAAQVVSHGHESLGSDVPNTGITDSLSAVTDKASASR